MIKGRNKMSNISVQVKYGAIKVHSVCTTETLSRADAWALIVGLKKSIDELDLLDLSKGE